MQKHASNAFGVLKAFSIGIPGGFGARIDVEAATGTADSGDPERDLAALLVEVGQVAQSGGTGAVFFLDEMHNSASASVVRDSLLRKDLVYSPRRGLIDFTVPLFGGYLRRHHPLSSFDEEEAHRVL